MLKPIKFTCQDHQGADMARVQQWDGKEWKIISGYYKADLSILDPMVKDAVGQVRRGEEDHAARLLQGELSAISAQCGERRRPAPPPALHARPEPSSVTDALPSRGSAAKADAAEPILAVNNIEVIYDHVILVLKGVSLDGAGRRHRRAARRQRRRQDPPR